MCVHLGWLPDADETSQQHTNIQYIMEYKVIIQYYGSNARDTLLFNDRKKAMECFYLSQPDFDSCIAWSAIFDQQGNQIES